MIKRLLDIWVAFCGLICLFPVFVLVAIAIKINSSGPVFFLQERIGRNGKPFWIWKFRSMVSNAASVGPHFTDKGDPRVTSVGRFLRRSSIDELPQLINVLAGSMSLVGPRPYLLKQKIDYSDEEWVQRHQVRPGITGLHQCTLRSQATLQQVKELDRRYVQQHGLRMDLWICWRTVLQVLHVGGNT